MQNFFRLIPWKGIKANFSVCVQAAFRRQWQWYGQILLVALAVLMGLLPLSITPLNAQESGKAEADFNYLPKIEARNYPSSLMRKTRSNRVLLLETAELPRTGKILLLRKNGTPAVGIRVLRTYPDKNRYAAKVVRQYPEVSTLDPGETLDTVEKLRDFRTAVANSLEDERELQELESDLPFDDELPLSDAPLEKPPVASGNALVEPEAAPAPATPANADPEPIETFVDPFTPPVTAPSEPAAPMEEPLNLDSEVDAETPSETSLEPSAASTEALEDFGDKTLNDTARTPAAEKSAPKELALGAEPTDLPPTTETVAEFDSADAEFEVPDGQTMEPLTFEDGPASSKKNELSPGRDLASDEGNIDFDEAEAQLKESRAEERKFSMDLDESESFAERNIAVAIEEIYPMEIHKHGIAAQFGYFRSFDSDGSAKYFSGGGLRYSLTVGSMLYFAKPSLQDALALELGTFFYKIIGFHTGDNDTYSVMPIIGTLRYSIYPSENYGFYLYGGLSKGLIVAKSATLEQFTNAETQLGAIGPAIGAGMIIRMGPNWETRVDIGTDMIGAGIMLRF